jgi:hypothetical protein
VDLAQSLEQVAAFLDSRGHRWALVGGLALQAYGFGRATHDIDILVESGARADIVPFMESLGFEPLHSSEGFSNHLHTDRRRVDFVYVESATAERLFALARRVTAIHGRDVVVPSPEHLIAMKVHAAKSDPSRLLREVGDIEYLLRHCEVTPSDVRRYFEAAGLLRWYDELTREA